MGMSLQEITEISSTTPLRMDAGYAITPPRVSNLFETYIVSIHPEYGVYEIVAIGKNIATTGEGVALRTAFNNVRNSIDNTYGRHLMTDRLERGSIWSRPRDFMMGLLTRERQLNARWNESTSSSLPNNDIYVIFLTANALNSTTGFLMLLYRSGSHAKIEATRRQQESSVF